MIRILQMIGSLEIGGSQTFVMNIYRKINREEIQFDFIIDKDGPSPYKHEIKKMGGKVYRLPTFKGTNINEITKSWDEFLCLHPEYKIIHFHVRSYSSILIPIAKRCGVFTIQHSHSTSDANLGHSFVKRMLEFPLRFQANYLMACSDEAGQWLFGKNVLKKTNYKTIKNAIDGEKFYFNSLVRNEVRKELNLENECFVLGNVGRMTPQKNHSYILKIFKEVLNQKKNSRLLLVGDGVLKEKIYNEAKELNIVDKCLFVGARTDAYRLYQAMDVFLFPSLWEGLGIVAVEAQASGLPCVASTEVPNSADIGAGLFTRLSLDDPIEDWTNALLKNEKFERKRENIALEQSGYEINDVVSFFERFYKLNYSGEK